MRQPSPENVVVIKSSIIFITPKQDFIEYFLNQGYEIKLSVKRETDQTISSTKFTLDYVTHDYIPPCIYCEEVDSLENGRLGIRARRSASRPGLKCRGDVVREGLECSPLDVHAISEGPSTSKICARKKKLKAKCLNSQETCTSGKEIQTSTPVLSVGCTQIEDLGTKTPVIIQNPVLKQRKPAIRVLQTELFSNKVVQ